MLYSLHPSHLHSGVDQEADELQPCLVLEVVLSSQHPHNAAHAQREVRVGDDIEIAAGDGNDRAITIVTVVGGGGA